MLAVGCRCGSAGRAGRAGALIAEACHLASPEALDTVDSYAVHGEGGSPSEFWDWSTGGLV